MSLNQLKFKEPGFDMGPIHAVLGQENSPNIDPKDIRVSRYRLANALRNKFGAGFRARPEAQKVLDHFDSEMQYFEKLNRIRSGHAIA